MEFSRQEYWCGCHYYSRGSSWPRTELVSLVSLHWQASSLPLTPPGKPQIFHGSPYYKTKFKLNVICNIFNLLSQSFLQLWSKSKVPATSATVQFSQFSRSVVSDSLRPHESQHARPPCPSPAPGVHSDSCPSSQRCHPAIYLILCRPLLLLPPIPPSIIYPIYGNIWKGDILPALACW